MINYTIKTQQGNKVLSFENDMEAYADSYIVKHFKKGSLLNKVKV